MLSSNALRLPKTIKYSEIEIQDRNVLDNYFVTSNRKTKIEELMCNIFNSNTNKEKLIEISKNLRLLYSCL